MSHTLFTIELGLHICLAPVTPAVGGPAPPNQAVKRMCPIPSILYRNEQFKDKGTAQNNAIIPPSSSAAVAHFFEPMTQRSGAI